MSDTARVTSIQAIKDFRDALCIFGEEARNAMMATDFESRRTVNFVLTDRLTYWKSEIKRRAEKENQAKLELHRKKVVGGDNEAKGLSTAREAVRDAKIRLLEAEEKVRIILKWKPILEHALSEYRGMAQPLGDSLQAELPHSLGLLDRMTAALEAYVSLAPPPAPVVAEPRGGTS